MKYVLIGKKNVGKSSIFNKIIGKKASRDIKKDLQLKWEDISE